MHRAMIISDKRHFFSLSPEEMERLLNGWGWAKYRGRQIRQWIYHKLRTDPNEISNLPKADRKTLTEGMDFQLGQVTRQQKSEDGTWKILTDWGGGAMAESVVIPEGIRRTACISSQVGCPVGCKFCASGLDGLKQNLGAERIVEQIFLMNRLLAQKRERITHVVFMGMGEPLANYANVMRAVRIIHHPECFNVGARRITISTVGVPARMRELAREELPLNLAISLHAPTEALRRELIPWAEHFSLADILDAARYYFERTGREVTLEYILLHGVNDKPEQARQLAAICKTLRANVNLIRYNEVAGLGFERPKAPNVMRFQTILRNDGVNAHVRKSRGRDIDAACGQLRRNAEGGNSKPEIRMTNEIRRSTGFTLIEFLVAAGIIAILAAIIIPYTEMVREDSRRTDCAAHLWRIGVALKEYGKANESSFQPLPQSPYDSVHKPMGYVAFTGPDGGVKGNDITASLWLLVRGGYVKDLSVFVCPSTSDQADTMTDALGMPVAASKRWNFRSPRNLSYSYDSPFTDAFNLTFSGDRLQEECAVLADKNPGYDCDGDRVLGPARDASPFELAKGNSRNHRQAGQNVLHPSGDVSFETTPYCGLGNDNIYTAIAPHRLTAARPVDGPGYIGTDVGPAYNYDSYLVPTARDAWGE
jgi:23S rRNA (adenine2503-C2)-methyltransferase